MKTLISFLLLFSSILSYSQEQMFVHTATASTIVGNITIIDNPDINGDPTARLLITHNYNPPGSPGVFNDNISGIRFNNVEQKWVIYNEFDTVDIVEGSSYNIYIAQGDEVFEHIHDAPTQPHPFYSYLDHPELNGDPGKNVVITNYWNPNGVANQKKYGTFYDEIELKWVLYTENFTNPLNGVAFFVGVEGTNVDAIRHEATPGSIVGNLSIIDHPLLNNNPEAVVVLTHNWGIAGDSSNVVIDKNLGVTYSGSNWAVHLEDQSAFPEDAKFDIFIYDPPLGVSDNVVDGLRVHPNPVHESLNIEAYENILGVTLFNVLGQKVGTFEGDDIRMLNLSYLKNGTYTGRNSNIECFRSCENH